MVLRQTRDALTKMGVEEIDPQGQPFDAELMNAVMQGTAEEGEPGTVCMVLQKGYKLGERVIRHDGQVWLRVKPVSQYKLNFFPNFFSYRDRRTHI